MKTLSNTSLFDLNSLSEPLAHGGYVYFVETRTDQKTNSYKAQLYRLHLATGEKIPFGNGGDYYSNLALTPDKQGLTFLGKADANSKPQVYQMPLTGGAALALTQEEGGVSRYLWAADSTTLYYQTVQAADANPTDTSKPANPTSSDEKLLSPRVFTQVRYQMDGRGYLTAKNHYQIRELVPGQEAKLVLEEDQELSLAHVTADGRQVLYNQAKTSPADFAWPLGQILTYDRESGQTRSLTATMADGNLSLVAVSPDETHYLLVGNQFDHQFVTQDQLYLYEVASGKISSLTKSLDRSIGDEIVADFQQGKIGVQVTWLDNDRFYFSVTDRGQVLLYEGRVSGDLQPLLSDKVHVTGASALEDGTYVVSYSTTSIPSRLALLKDGQLEDLYDPNQAILADHTVVEPQGFTYKGHGDWDIQGWYLPPLGVSGQHPAILYIHGGPQVCYGESFFHEMQVLAAQGYGVIMLNPRGGSSYGQEFVAAILGDYGNLDYDDLMRGVDHVLEQHPEIDDKSLYLAGGSYGGFMTNWIIGHTNRFKAACTQRSISNWLSFYGASDIGPFFIENQLRADLTQADRLWELSPLAYAHQIETPLLVLHGEEDRRCPLEQGQQIYMAVKKAGVDTKLITFPESSHGLSRDGLPNLRIERLKAIQNWFQTH